MMKIDKELRMVGIPGIDPSPWGTHFCQFYETKEGLLDLLVRYFKTGLENHEFCLWVTSAYMHETDAIEAMTKAVPEFDRYVQGGQIEIIPHTQWYLKDRDFDLERVLQAWIERHNRALARGYDGIRVTGDATSTITSLRKSGWNDFIEYEQMLDKTIRQHKMLVHCTYALDKCDARSIIDVVQHHQFALVERPGTWERIESAELKRTKAELKQLNDRLETLVDERTTQLKSTVEAMRQSHALLHAVIEGTTDAVYVKDLQSRYLMINSAGAHLIGKTVEYVIGKDDTELFPLETARRFMDWDQHIMATGAIETKEEMVTASGVTHTYLTTKGTYCDQGGRVIGLIGIARDITERKRMEEIHAQLLEALISAQEDERRRIARELHDETGQSLTSLLVGLRTIQDVRTLEEAKTQADHLRTLTSKAMKEVERLAQGLRPTMLDDMGLETALKRHVSDFSQTHGMAVEVDTIGVKGERLPPHIEIALFRIAQEALTNTAKHAAAKHVSIMLRRYASEIEMVVEDDGIGFEPVADLKAIPPSAHLGLHGMRERVSMLGGVIAIESVPGQGTVIHVRVPLQRKAT